MKRCQPRTCYANTRNTNTVEINMPKNTYFLAPHPGKFRIFNKRNDGTITKHIDSLGKPGKGRSVTPTLEE